MLMSTLFVCRSRMAAVRYTVAAKLNNRQCRSMRDTRANSPVTAWILVSLAGLIVFSAAVGAGVSISEVGNWLLKPPDNLVTLIGAGLVGGGLLLTAANMQADRIAKRDEASSRRLEQYALRIREFRTLQTNAAIMMLLNYDRDIVVRAGDAPVRCCWNETALALVPGCFRHYLYEPKITLIRDCFNDLLEGMSRLHFLLVHELVRPADVDHICKPLLDRLIRDPKFSVEPVARNLRLYILWRNPRGVLRLCERYGLPIHGRRDADVADLKRELQRGTYGPWELTGWGNLNAPSSGGGSPFE